MKKNIKDFLIIISAFILNFVLIFATDYQCPWKLTGIECAGCGATRMIKALFRLEIYQAFRYNPLIFILMIIGIIYLIYVLVCILFKKQYIMPNKKTLITLVAVVLLFMILRNTETFSFLKPTEIN